MRDFKNHIFKAAGAAAGFLAGLGIFGIIFGLIGGAFIDQLFKNHRQKKYIRKFLEHPSGGDTEDCILLESAAAAIVWQKCRKDPLKSGVFRQNLHVYLKAAPRCLAETIEELESIDYDGIRSYFSTYADDPLRNRLESFQNACGLAGKTPVNTASAADYELLGLSPGAKPEEVKKVYRRLASQFHPDSGATLSDEQLQISSEAFKKIKEAYERIIQSHKDGTR